jgi:nicotinamide mononucleotide adenylyltransferase
VRGLPAHEAHVERVGRVARRFDAVTVTAAMNT